jgi:hypothetical protein
MIFLENRCTPIGSKREGMLFRIMLLARVRVDLGKTASNACCAATDYIVDISPQPAFFDQIDGVAQHG